MPSDLRTRAIVLRRTNYGESDRILNLLTPEGKIPVVARGVRKEKSRLAGSIELFSVSDVVIHQGKSKLAILTSAKMLQFFSHILSDVTSLELAAFMMKKVEAATEQVFSPDYFSLLIQALDGLNRQLDRELVRAWFLLNLARIGGEELNLIRDIDGNNLSPELNYVWDATESALRPDAGGQIDASAIKFTRFLLANPLRWATKIDGYGHLLTTIQPLVLSRK